MVAVVVGHGVQAIILKVVVLEVLAVELENLKLVEAVLRIKVIMEVTVSI